MKKILAVLATSVAMFFAACASNNAAPDGAKATTSNLMQLTLLKEKYVEKHGVAGVGEGIAVKEQNAMSQAQMMARADIAASLGAKSQQLIKAWNEEVGLTTAEGSSFESNSHQEQVNKEIVSEKVAGASTVKMMTEVLPDGRYKVAVLMAMDPESLAKFAQALKNSEAVHEQVRARAEAAYTEADDMFAAYDAMKNGANGL